MHADEDSSIMSVEPSSSPTLFSADSNGPGLPLPRLAHVSPAVRAKKPPARAASLTATYLLGHSRDFPTLPTGFFFESFPSRIQCAICRAPFSNPVRFHPCAHGVCRKCAGDDLSQCPRCNVPGTTLSEVGPDERAMAAHVEVGCDYCSWHGRPNAAANHTCRPRQLAKAVDRLKAEPGNSKAWFMLGASLRSATDTKVVQGVTVGKRECYINSLTLDPVNAMAWANLAVTIPPGGRVRIGDTQFSRRDTIVRALELDPTLASAWFNLGNNLQRGQHVMVSGEKAFKDTCYLRALQQDRRLAVAWYNLGLCLDKGMVVDFNDREYDAAMCFISSLLAKRDFADAWLKLAIVGPAGKVFFGQRWSAPDCAAQAVGLDTQRADAWAVLLRVMRVDESVSVTGHDMTYDEVEAEASRLAPEHNAGSAERGRSTKSRGAAGGAPGRGGKIRDPTKSHSPSRPASEASSGPRTPRIVTATPGTPGSGRSERASFEEDKGSSSCVVM